MPVTKLFRTNILNIENQIAWLSTSAFKCKDVTKVLSSVLGSKLVSSSQTVREQHSIDESHHRYLIPTTVVWPNTVEEVCEVAKVCNAHKIPMIPFGTGTGLEGGIAPLEENVVCVDLTNMNEIVKLNLNDFDVQVRPGVTRKQLNHELKNTGLWFPVDPGADASLTGMVATGASGTNAVRYGTMKENVLNLEVVLADGTLLNTGGKRRCRKSSAGYNLTELFVGSEGTLGFITAATLRLHGVPETSKSAVCSFPSVMSAVITAMQVMQCNIPIARIELLDSASMLAINKYNKDVEYAIQPTLFLEFHGTDVSTKEQIDKTAEIANANNGSCFHWAQNLEDVNRLWYARHNVFYALRSLKPGSNAFVTDVCVPISALPNAIDHSVGVLDKCGIVHGIVGHVGDGNFHCALMVDNDETDLAEEAVQSIGRRAIELEGTCTGEHGIGIGKKKLLIKEVGINSIQVMQLLKKSLDPNNLMNPGKLI